MKLNQNFSFVFAIYERDLPGKIIQWTNIILKFSFFFLGWIFDELMENICSKLWIIYSIFMNIIDEYLKSNSNNNNPATTTKYTNIASILPRDRMASSVLQYLKLKRLIKVVNPRFYTYVLVCTSTIHSSKVYFSLPGTGRIWAICFCLVCIYLRSLLSVYRYLRFSIKIEVGFIVNLFLSLWHWHSNSVNFLTFVYRSALLHFTLEAWLTELSSDWQIRYDPSLFHMEWIVRLGWLFP